MARLKFGAFLAPHHPIGEHPMLQFRRDLDFVEQLDALAEDPELEVNISANSSWYGHGTWFIEVRRSLP